jgi:cell division protease FtsH
MSERLGARKFGSGDGEPFLGREMSHSRDYSEEIASAIDDEVRRLIESAHDEAWEILVQYRDVLDNLVLQLIEHETLSRQQVLSIFSPIHKRATRGSYTGYGKRLPSDRPPVLTPKEMALTAAPDGEQPAAGNGQALGGGQAPGGQAVGGGSQAPGGQALGGSPDGSAPQFGPGGQGGPDGLGGHNGPPAGGPAPGGPPAGGVL